MALTILNYILEWFKDCKEYIGLQQDIVIVVVYVKEWFIPGEKGHMVDWDMGSVWIYINQNLLSFLKESICRC